jgi:hypothetical protein
MTRFRGVVVALVAVVLAVSCSGDDDDEPASTPTEPASEPDESTSAPTGSGAVTAEPTNCGDDVSEPELRDELVEMQEADQAERTGASPEFNDAARTERLREIVDEHGWPTCDLVGVDGNSAAWLIAQHSDHDVEFQQQALELMREAVADGTADATEMAYLEDRVAVNTGEPQVYGTQVECVAGRAEARNLADPDGVDERRAEVGMEPAALEDYLADFEEGCAAGG